MIISYFLSFWPNICVVLSLEFLSSTFSCFHLHWSLTWKQKQLNKLSWKDPSSKVNFKTFNSFLEPRRATSLENLLACFWSVTETQGHLRKALHPQFIKRRQLVEKNAGWFGAIDGRETIPEMRGLIRKHINCTSDSLIDLPTRAGAFKYWRLVTLNIVLRLSN